MTVAEYELRFATLSKYPLDIVDTEEAIADDSNKVWVLKSRKGVAFKIREFGVLIETAPRLIDAGFDCELREFQRGREKRLRRRERRRRKEEDGEFPG